VQYLPASYGRAQPQRYEDRSGPAYVERQPISHGMALDAEEAYEPPPLEIKVEPSVAQEGP
jgi:hypothetical protein